MSPWRRTARRKRTTRKPTIADDDDDDVGEVKEKNPECGRNQT